MGKNGLIESFKKQTNKLINILSKMEDENLTMEERKEISKAYDLLTVHGSISLEQIQEA